MDLLVAEFGKSCMECTTALRVGEDFRPTLPRDASLAGCLSLSEGLCLDMFSCFSLQCHLCQGELQHLTVIERAFRMDLMGSRS